jgi:hypothetical protein
MFKIERELTRRDFLKRAGSIASIGESYLALYPFFSKRQIPMLPKASKFFMKPAIIKNSLRTE